MNLVDNKSHGNFLSGQLVDSVRSTICFIILSTTSILNSSLVNQEIGYAQGKGLKTILLVSTKLKNELHDIKSHLTIMEFTEDDFMQKCFSIADMAIKISEIMEEPIDFEAFLDFYAKTKDSSLP